MALISYADSALSVLPPVIAITAAILTRQVLLSLGMGILIGILMLSDFSVAMTVSQVADRAVGLVWDDGLSLWNIYTVGFLVCMGTLMALISVSGGTRAFATWARNRLKTGRDAKLMTIFLGFIIFIDDYFNALLVGNISRPMTDQYNISREKLAYCIDSTSAPVCVVSPISTWGAYIMSLLAGIIATHDLNISALSMFVQMVPMNFYALFAFALLLCVVLMNLNVGAMATAEQRAANGELWDANKGNPASEGLDLPEADNGSILNLMGPLALLISLVVGLMMYSGNSALAAAGESFSLIGALENADGAWAMITAGVVTVVVTILGLLRQQVSVAVIAQAIGMGVRSMLPAVYILLMAWTIAGVVSDLETGQYLASLTQNNLPAFMVPVLIFVLAAFTAFSTGTSYGTFAIMLPIAANMALVLDASLLLPAMSAVLAGGVFGDHCSPISDTTILSSTGSGCHHIDHVNTQLPYAIIAALVAIAGYLTLGVTGGSAMIGMGVALVLFVGIVMFLSRQNRACVASAA